MISIRGIFTLPDTYSQDRIDHTFLYFCAVSLSSNLICRLSQRWTHPLFPLLTLGVRVLTVSKLCPELLWPENQGFLCLSGHSLLYRCTCAEYVHRGSECRVWMRTELAFAGRSCHQETMSGRICNLVAQMCGPVSMECRREKPLSEKISCMIEVC